MVKSILPVFKDEQDKIIVVAMIIASMFLVFIPALLVVLFLKERVSEGSFAISKMFLNFELLLFLISLIFAVPLIGWLLGVVLGHLMMIGNIIICIINLCAVAKGAEIKVPVPYEFI